MLLEARYLISTTYYKYIARPQNEKMVSFLRAPRDMLE